MISSRLLLSAVLVPSLLAASAAAQPAQLVKDVATEQLPAVSFPADYLYFVEMGGRLYFAADDDVHGYELWSSDGSEAGTEMVADICPGICHSRPAWLTVSGNRIFFAAHDGVHGNELWVSDGTAAGTRLVADLVPGLSSRRPSWLTADGAGGLYFAADDLTHGVEPWHSDGTAAGTAMIVDLRPGAAGSSPEQLELLPTGLFFTADDGSHGREPWTTDGTAVNTASLGDLNPGTDASTSGGVLPSSTPINSKQARVGNLLVFVAGDGVHGSEPWVTDGTPGGTRLLEDVRGGNASSDPYAFLEFDGRVYFTARDPSLGGVPELWSTDGVADTHRVAPVYANPLGVAGGQLFLRAFDAATGSELWKTDGTEPGTVPVADILPGPTSSFDFFSLFSAPAAVGDDLLFFADDGTAGMEPWISDGTGAGTHRLRDVNPGPQLSVTPFFISNVAVPFGGEVYFWAFGGVGLEPWVTDGTEAGTRLLADVDHQASAIEICFWFHCPQRPAAVDGRLYLRLKDSTTGTEPWVSTGTFGGTRLLADIEPSVVDGDPAPSLPTDFTAAGTTAVFDANMPAGGRRLYAARSQRTPHGAWFPTTVEPVADVSDSQPAVSAFGLAFFRGHDDDAGNEPWKTDGTGEGTERVIDLRPGPDGSEPHSLTPFGDEVFFAAFEDATGEELYATDGSGPGTRRVGDLVPGPDSSAPRALAAAGSLLFFSAETAATGRELWVSDGSGANTAPVIDLLPGPGSALPVDLNEVPVQHAVIVGGRSVGADGAFFVADDGTHGQELWWSDGSAGGTRLLETFAGPRGGEPRHLTPLDGRTFFVADDGVHGRELWTSDGTAAGTRLVTDLVPGAGSSLPAWLTPVDGVLYFTAHRADVGTELWRTDGTAAGTELVQDVFPGPSPSSPENLTAAGRRLFFLANDGTHGFELWSMLLPTRVPRLTLTADGDFAPRGEVAFTLLLHNPAPEKLYDLVGDELYFLLPVEFRVLRVTADRGVAEHRRIGGLPDPEGTAVLPPPISIVDWNGSLEPGETLTLVIEAQLLGETAGQTYQLSARLAYDSDQDGDGDQRLRSDDPSLPGDMDVTEIVVAAQAVEVPAASEIGLVLLALLLAAAAVVRLRRRVA